MLACFSLFDDNPARIDSLELEFRGVTPEELTATARKYLRPENRTVMTLVAGAAGQAAK